MTEENARTDGRKRLVVLESDAGVRWSLEKGLGRSGYDIVCAGTVQQVLQMTHAGEVDGIILELQPEGGIGLDSLASIASVPGAPPLLCVSVDPAPHMVVECMRRGAFDFLTKPFSLAEVRGALSRALRSPNQVAVRAGGNGRDDGKGTSFIVGVSPAIQELRTIIQQVGQTDLNCLVRGESGAGKDLVAREIHRLSQRRDKPFVKVNCSALPEQLLESELFGYEKGAFTGAVTAKPGRFSLAHKGIIFLDEIGDMQPGLQAKILQVIEHKEFTKLGGSGHTRVDVQIIAATNVNLEERTASNAFRNDLFFRLNEVSIWVPPLRDRREDIPLLVYHFIQKHSQYAPGQKPDLAPEDMAALMEYDWPGNVRELESAVKRWLVLGKRALTPHLAEPAAKAPRQRARKDDGKTELKARKEKEQEQQREEEQEAPEPTPEEIQAALEKHKWNRRKAAQELNMTYQVLRRRIEKYEIRRRSSAS